MVIERLAYDGLAERYDVDIFTANQTGQDFSQGHGEAQAAHLRLRRHRFRHRAQFADDLDTSERSGGLRQAAARLPDPDTRWRLQP